MEFTVTATFPASAKDVYDAWLDSEEHANMTAATNAIASNDIGADHMAHDGYISGTNLELVPNEKIVQSWRTTEFSPGEEDSLIEVTMKEDDGVTTVTLKHSKLADNGGHYEQGWKDHYFAPMNEYFSAK